MSLGKSQMKAQNQQNRLVPPRFLPRIPHLGSLLFCLGCSDLDSNDSQPLQLTSKDFACSQYSDAEQSTHLQYMPPQMIDTESFRQGKPDDVLNQLTGIPQSLLQYLYQRANNNRFKISEAFLGRGTMGVTLLRGFNSLTMEPESIKIAATPGAINFALQHEIGHAIEAKVKNKDPQENQRLWTNVFQEARNNSKLRSYAKRSPGEYFAEAFANYYCSPDSHNFIALELPKTYGLLQNLLPQPRWAESETAPTTTGPTTPAPAAPAPVNLNNSLFVFIESAPSGEAHIFVSGPAEVKNIDLCMDSTELCLKKTNLIPAFKPVETQNLAIEKNTGRAFLKSLKTIALKNEMQLSITALDDRGRKLGIKSLVVKRKT